MTLAQGIALFIIAYLALLARSAWLQNELPQFLRVTVGTDAENTRFLAALKEVLGK